MNSALEQIQFRTALWRDFVASYQVVLISAPEKFSDYCEAFRKRWIMGK
jgi:hypothetical protein